MDNSPHSRSFLHPVAGVLAGILVHNVALSTLETLNGNLSDGRLASFGGVNAVILLIGAAAGLLSFLIARRLRRALSDRLRVSGANPAHSLLDTSLLKQAPGREHKWILAGYGLAAIAFLSALHTVSHVVWHWFNHGLHLSHAAIIVASAILALLLAAWASHGEKPESVGTKGDPGNNDALILFLSEAKDPATFFHLPDSQPMPWRKSSVRNLLGSHFWAVPARSISRIWENGALCHIVVIVSETSSPQFPVFAEGIRRGMASSPAEIHRLPAAAGIDFFDFASVKSAVEAAYTLLEAKGMRRIAIDVTSGTKICTAVGLLESLPPGRGAIYVTNLLDVYAYDFEHFDSRWNALPHEGP